VKSGFGSSVKVIIAGWLWSVMWWIEKEERGQSVPCEFDSRRDRRKRKAESALAKAAPFYRSVIDMIR
jgi:hypothetical protein